MPRIRTIKPEFWDSPDTAKASAVARLLYMAMWNWADDHGRGTANLKELEGFAFPNDDIAELSGGKCRTFRDVVTEVQNVYGVRFYTVAGRPYYEIPSWNRHQRNERRAEGKHPDSKQGASWDVAEAPIFSVTPERSNEEPPRSSGLGTGEQGNRGTENPPTPQRAETNGHTNNNGAGKALDQIRATNLTARSPDAHRIAQALSDSQPVPIEASLLAEVGVQIDRCLKSSIPPPAIAAGLKAWIASDSWSPTQINRFVMKANNRTDVGKPTQKAMGAHEAAERVIARMKEQS